MRDEGLRVGMKKPLAVPAAFLWARYVLNGFWIQ